MRVLSEEGKLAIAQWYAARAKRPGGPGLKSLYGMAGRLVAILPVECQSAAIMLRADQTLSGRDETMVLTMAVHCRLVRRPVVPGPAAMAS